MRFPWRSPHRDEQRDAQLDAELQSHIAESIRERTERGESPEQARDAARKEFGNVSIVKETTREMWGWRWLETLAQDLRYAARSLRRNPGFSAAVILALALGIGVNVTMFIVVDALFFRYPPDIAQPEKLLDLYAGNQRGSEASLNYDGFSEMAGVLPALDVTAWVSSTTDFGRGRDAREVPVQYVTDSYFRVLGTPLLAGRPFTTQEWRRESPGSVAIVSYRFWKSALHGDPAILGRYIWVGGNQYSVVGIAPHDFNGVGLSVNDVWLPFGAAFAPDRIPWFETIARVRPGCSLAEARSEANRTWQACCSKELVAGFSAILDPYFVSQRKQVSDTARVALWLAGTSLIVLLIACANVANLLLVRLLQRGHELAVRMQLGASRLRLISHASAEIALLGLLGGVAALVATRTFAPLSRDYLLWKTFDERNFVDWHMLAFTLLFTFLAAAGIAALILLRASKPNIARTLRLAGRGASGERWPLRSALLMGQVALTLALSVGASLFVHSLRNVHAIQLGYDPDRILIASAHLESGGYQDGDIDATYESLAERVRSIPDVEKVGIASYAPLVAGMFSGGRLTPEDAARAQRKDFGGRFTIVSPEYFEALGITASAGRVFTAEDGNAPVVVVDDILARENWPGVNPVGRCVLLYHGDACQTVIGVVPAVQDRGVTGDHRCVGCDKGELYLPLSGIERINKTLSSAKYPVRNSAGALLIRTFARARAAAPQILRALNEISPSKRYVSLQPLSDVVDTDIRTWSTGASMFSFFSTLALALTAIGIYGLLAYSVRQRTREIGVRMALGAQPGDVLRLVTSQAMRLVPAGIALGLAAAFGLSRLIASLLYNVKPSDAASYVVASAVLAAVAILACWLPARRAMRVDPMQALRYE